MPSFLKEEEVNLEVSRIIQEASSRLILISPYVKLHKRYIDGLKGKERMHALRIVFVFRKDLESIYKNISFEDLTFLMSFPNVEIRCEERLHAKYYANEKQALLTSMNLYKASQDNNIEFGVLQKNSLVKKYSFFRKNTSFKQTANEYFEKVINNSEIIFKRKPNYEIKHFGLIKQYKDSTIVINEIPHIPNVIKKVEAVAPKGYCIRTGESIDFNPKRPFSFNAFKDWELVNDIDKPENYCHLTGEESYGKTSFKKPILYKNWEKAKIMEGLFNTSY